MRGPCPEESFPTPCLHEDPSPLAQKGAIPWVTPNSQHTQIYSNCSTLDPFSPKGSTSSLCTPDSLAHVGPLPGRDQLPSQHSQIPGIPYCDVLSWCETPRIPADILSTPSSLCFLSPASPFPPASCPFHAFITKPNALLPQTLQSLSFLAPWRGSSAPGSMLGSLIKLCSFSLPILQSPNSVSPFSTDSLYQSLGALPVPTGCLSLLLSPYDLGA